MALLFIDQDQPNRNKKPTIHELVPNYSESRRAFIQNSRRTSDEAFRQTEANVTNKRTFGIRTSKENRAGITDVEKPATPQEVLGALQIDRAPTTSTIPDRPVDTRLKYSQSSSFYQPTTNIISY